MNRSGSQKTQVCVSSENGSEDTRVVCQRPWTIHDVSLLSMTSTSACVNSCAPLTRANAR